MKRWIVCLWLALVLPWAAGAVEADGSSEGSTPPPARIEGALLYLESTSGLQVASCGTEACFAAGNSAPAAEQYCDLEAFPEGCVRRWVDQSAYIPTGGFNPPEWETGRDVGQSDSDKPGFIADCLGGQPCMEVGGGEVQSRTLEIALGQEIGPLDGPFSLFFLVRPVAQREDFFYFGYGGSELVQRSARNGLDLRLGVGRPVEVSEDGAVQPGAWQLVEIHRDGRGALRSLVDGWDRTPGRPVATGPFSFRHLRSIGRARAMEGELAALMIYDRQLREAEAQELRSHLGQTYGLSFGDGSRPPKRPGVVELERRLWLHWTFDAIRKCRATYRGELVAEVGPRCPTNGPRPVDGRFGGALSFDGVDDEVRSSGPLGPMDQLYSFTAAGWMRSDMDGAWQTILDKRDALEDGWDLYLDPDGRGFLRVDAETLDGERVLTDGRWHHLAGVFDGERMFLYVDGKLDRSRYIGRRQPVETTREVAAGRNYAGRRDAFRGELDELRIYGRALDPQEIQALAAFDEDADQGIDQDADQAVDQAADQDADARDQQNQQHEKDK